MSKYRTLITYYDSLRTATSYTETYLKHGSACDSSDDANMKMAYVNKALQSMEVKRLVLDIATELCLREIMSLSDVLEDQLRDLNKWIEEKEREK